MAPSRAGHGAGGGQRGAARPNPSLGEARGRMSGPSGRQHPRLQNPETEPANGVFRACLKRSRTR